MKADDLINGWKGGFARYDRTDHHVNGLKIDRKGDEATATSRVIATHVRGTTRWTCGGHYRHHLVRRDGGWRIDAMTFTMEWEQGER